MQQEISVPKCTGLCVIKQTIFVPLFKTFFISFPKVFDTGTSLKKAVYCDNIIIYIYVCVCVFFFFLKKRRKTLY